MDNSTNFSAHVTVRIKKDSVFFGPGIAQLLQGVDTCGSVRDAALGMGLSYSKAWKVLNASEKELGYSLVVRHHGGKQGGKTTLSEKGRFWLDKYMLFEEALKKSADDIFAQMLKEEEGNV